MLFPTNTFAMFFVVVLTISWLLMPRRRRWKLFMIAASYFFYGYWNWRFVFLIGASTIANQIFAQQIHRNSTERLRRRWLIAAIAFNLGLLGYFKYYDFFVTSATNTLNSLGLGISPAIVAITLPVGISFFTFQALSYVIDVYRGSFTPVRLFDFAVYLSFFPHIVAGPIVRASEFLPQLKERHDPRKIDATRAFFLIFIGLFKKVVIANFLATHIVDIAFASPTQHSSLEMVVAVYAYAVQIYADFSGYTDMAIGLALLLGFRFPQNFDSPYTATSIQDFWRRWHMTLSRWLRDYFYIPLGGNRSGRRRTYRNLMITMLLGGLWHGAAWTFVAWGGIHGGFLCLEHWRQNRRLKTPEVPTSETPTSDTEAPGASTAVRARQRVWIQRLATFHVVCFAWIFFRAESFSAAIDVLTRIVDPAHWLENAPLVTFGVLLAIAVGIGEQFIPRQTLARMMATFSRLSLAAQGVVLGFALLVTGTLGPQGVAPFIYFQF